MKILKQDLRDSKGNEIYGIVDRDGNVIINAEIRDPRLQKFVAKHEGEHVVQLRQHHPEHKYTEAMAHLQVIKHAETKEGKIALSVKPTTEAEADLQTEIGQLVGLYKKHGGKGKRNTKNWWQNPEAARLAAEEMQGSKNPERDH